MITGNQDFMFVVLAYGGVGAVTLVLITLVWWQSRQVRRSIATLEAQGVRRRSAATVGSSTAP